MEIIRLLKADLKAEELSSVRKKKVCFAEELVLSGLSGQGRLRRGGPGSAFPGSWCEPAGALH